MTYLFVRCQVLVQQVQDAKRRQPGVGVANRNPTLSVARILVLHRDSAAAAKLCDNILRTDCSLGRQALAQAISWVPVLFKALSDWMKKGNTHAVVGKHHDLQKQVNLLEHRRPAGRCPPSPGWKRRESPIRD